ncbi:DUF2512 family protein [Paenibacillus alkalitolerans]|uniref:DUF2512 family protein n=1 Tax=Paenibacillus alkalitolerans TaxID=2799335 RepID=UPI0018F600FA|nr:DUF2512 family protein [Paenibacillus alkalitolerans]
MIVLLMKLVATPLVLWLADWMLADVYYPTLTSSLSTGLTLAIIGYGTEWLMLRRGTLWLTTIVDWAVTAAIVYVSQFMFPGTFVTVMGALLTGGVMAIAEYFMHRYAIDRGALATRA